jgi:hypothetical protein
MSATSEHDGSAPDVTTAPSATEPSPATGEPAGAGSEREPPSWEEVRQLRAEAKRHRLTKNAAEQERDQLRGRVDAQDRREVERIAGDRLASPGDLWLTTQLADLRDEDGELDSDKIGERVESVLSDRPHWRKTSGPPPNFSSGVRQPLKQPKTIGEAFKNALHTGR